jgi:hypothetical protein
MRKLLILLILVIGLVIGDFAVKQIAERRVASELQASFDPEGEGTVEFGGFPFIVRLLSGSVPVTEISSSSLERRGVRFTDVRMTLQDVEFSWSKIMAGEIGSVSVRDGHGRAELEAGALTKVFAALGRSISLDADGGEVRASFGPFSGTAQLSIDGTDLVLGIEGTERTVRVALPRFVQGLQYRSVRINGSEAVVEFSLEDASFRQL